MNRQSLLPLYVLTIGAITTAALVFSAVATIELGSSTVLGNLIPAALLIAISWYGSQRRVLVSQTDSWVMGTVGHIAAIVLLPYSIAILAIATSKILAESVLLLNNERPTWKGVIVNISGTILAAAAGSFGFSAVHGASYLWGHGARALLALPALLLMVVLYNTVNELVVVGAITLTGQDNPWWVFWRMSRAALVPEFSLSVVGIVFAILWHSTPAMAALIIVPILFSLRAFESVARLRQETIEAVLRMAEHLDYRDTNTYEHSQRLANLTRRLASQLELTPEHVEEIVLASRVHDLGKIGISNEILLKQGPLTPEEYRIMSQHPVIGVEILSSYSMFQSSISIVRHHHERWDGKGYPDGIAGERIPLGARVISIADSFDAMTADRPYRKGLSVDDAVERLKAGMGTQYDPKLCAIFIRTLIDDKVYVPREPPPELHIISGGRVG